VIDFDSFLQWFNNPYDFFAHNVELVKEYKNGINGDTSSNEMS
jgi:hypothetical protein